MKPYEEYLKEEFDKIKKDYPTLINTAKQFKEGFNIIVTVMERKTKAHKEVLTKWLNENFDYFLYIIFHNNGTYWWQLGDPPEDKHFSVCKAMQLKGVEAGTTWFIHRSIMPKLRTLLNKKYNLHGFVNGNCKICGKCPLKDKYVNCKKGMP